MKKAHNRLRKCAAFKVFLLPIPINIQKNGINKRQPEIKKSANHMLTILPKIDLIIIDFSTGLNGKLPELSMDLVYFLNYRK